MTEATMKQLAQLRELKRATLDLVLQASIDTALDLSVEASSVWVHWGEMSSKEKDMYPEAKAEGGFFRVAVDVSGVVMV